MKKQPSKSATEPADDDILPPQEAAENDDMSDTGQATRAAGAHLRMPPLIDHAESWTQGLANGVRQRFSGFAGVVQSGSLHLLRRTAYHLTLWTLVTATLLITGFGIWQARHIEMPQLDSFWFNSERVLKDRLERINNGAVSVSDNQALDDVSINAPLTAPLKAPLKAMPIDELQNRLSEAAANQQAENRPEENPPFIDAPVTQADAALTQNAELKAELEESRARLAAAEAKIAGLSARAETANASDGLLRQRHAMADLLLRLEAGLAYDDILAAGHLQPVLSRRELALLALHGAMGIPTEAALALQFNGWVAMLSPPNKTGAYRDMMDWLAENAAGLVQISEVPLALAGDTTSDAILSDTILTDIAAALASGRLDDAAINMGRLLRQLESGEAFPPSQLAALQAVYDDTRAAAELAPLLAKLKRDYISGARP